MLRKLTDLNFKWKKLIKMQSFLLAIKNLLVAFKDSKEDLIWLWVEEALFFFSFL